MLRLQSNSISVPVHDLPSQRILDLDRISLLLIQDDRETPNQFALCMQMDIFTELVPVLFISSAESTESNPENDLKWSLLPNIVLKCSLVSTKGFVKSV